MISSCSGSEPTDSASSSLEDEPELEDELELEELLLESESSDPLSSPFSFFLAAGFFGAFFFVEPEELPLLDEPLLPLESEPEPEPSEYEPSSELASFSSSSTGFSLYFLTCSEYKFSWSPVS